MSLATLATIDDLATITGETFASGEALPQLVLELASAAIRRDAGQTITLIEDDEVQLAGNWTRELSLPERPVVAVSDVRLLQGNVDGSWSLSGVVDVASYGWNRRGKLRRALGGWWGGDGATVQVTYTHGYAVIPDLIRGLCLQVAARILADPESAGIKEETIGSYHYVAAASGVMLTEDEKKSLYHYRYQPAA